MKATIEISDEELLETVKCTLVRRAVEKVETELWEKSCGTSRYLRIYDKAIAEGVRSLLKEHMEDLTDRAVNAAAKSISNKGVRKLLDSLGNQLEG